MDGIITVDSEQRIVLFNAAAEQMFGYRADQLMTQPLGRLIPERFRAAHTGHVRSFGETGVTNRQMGALGPISGVRADGTEFPVEASISQVEAAGQKLFTVILRDITDRTQAEESLRESQERIRAIVASAVEGIITIDERGAIESVNPAAEETFGYAASELMGKNVSVLMPSPYHEEHDGYLANYLRTGEAKIIGIGREVVGRRKDGAVFPMDLSVSEVKLPGKRLFTGFVRDITERKQAGEKVAQLAHTLAEKNRELEAIVYVASHDLRSPLVNIEGFSNELTRICKQMQAAVAAAPGGTVPAAVVQEAFATDIPRALRFIQAGVARIDTLLNGFLRFSRLGRESLTIQTLDMNALVAGVAQALKFQLEQAGASLQLGRLPSCQGDAMHIGQVFSNLIDNAVKYRDAARSLRITISGWVESGRAIYAVTDNGIGIAPEHREKIFEIFHRLNPNTGAGEGLGLTIAQRILERHNGKLWVEGQSGVGSTFFISLPAEEMRQTVNNP
jgi:PAS domain S-box-containing protein